MFFGRDKRDKEKKQIKVRDIPEGFSKEDIKIESSICTGEKTIGFYDKTLKRLVAAELVRTKEDIEDFYCKYGIDRI